MQTIGESVVREVRAWLDARPRFFTNFLIDPKSPQAVVRNWGDVEWQVRGNVEYRVRLRDGDVRSGTLPITILFSLHSLALDGFQIDKASVLYEDVRSDGKTNRSAADWTDETDEGCIKWLRSIIFTTNVRASGDTLEFPLLTPERTRP